MPNPFRFIPGTLAVFVLLTMAAPVQAAGAACKVAMLPLEVQGLSKLEGHIPVLLSETMSHEISEATSCDVITDADIRSLLELEERKTACGVDSASCLSEMGDALGVDFVISGTLGKLGNIYSLNMRMLDTELAQVIARSQRAVTNDATLLRRAARDTARELFRLEPLSEDELNDVVEGATWVNRVLFWGGLSTMALSMMTVVLGTFTAGGLFYFLSFDRTSSLAPFKTPAQAFFPYPFVASLAAVGFGALGTLIFGVSFAVE